MIVHLYFCILTVLFCGVHGDILNTADSKTCIELCSGCDGIATFENGHCECHVADDNQKGAECLIRMKRQAKELGVDLIDCELANEERPARCTVGSRRRFNLNDVERVASYFMNGGPQSGNTPPIGAANPVFNTGNPMANSYGQMVSSCKHILGADKPPSGSSINQKPGGRNAIVGAPNEPSMTSLPTSPMSSKNTYTGTPSQHPITGSIPHAINPMSGLLGLLDPKALLGASTALLHPQALSGDPTSLFRMPSMPLMPNLLSAANPMGPSGDVMADGSQGQGPVGDNQLNERNRSTQNKIVGAPQLSSSPPVGSYYPFMDAPQTVGAPNMAGVPRQSQPLQRLGYPSMPRYGTYQGMPIGIGYPQMMPFNPALASPSQMAMLRQSNMLGAPYCVNHPSSMTGAPNSNPYERAENPSAGQESEPDKQMTGDPSPMEGNVDNPEADDNEPNVEEKSTKLEKRPVKKPTKETKGGAPKPRKPKDATLLAPNPNASKSKKPNEDATQPEQSDAQPASELKK